MTVSAGNISTSRTVQFTVEEIISLAWKAAKMLDVRQEPTTEEKEFARKWILIKMDSLQARARIARSVIFEEVDLTASTGEYELDESIFDVIGDAKLVDEDGIDIAAVSMRSRSFYQNIADKTIEGTPTIFYPEKLDKITLKPWPIPETTYVLRIQAVKWLRSADSVANTVDLERHFQEYLVVALAYEIARASSIDMAHVAMLRADAEKLLNFSIGAAKQRGPTQMVIRHRTGWNR